MSDKTVTSLLPAVQSNTQNNQGNECQICRSFRTDRGLPQHLNTYRQETPQISTRVATTNQMKTMTREVQEPEQQHEDFYWNTVPGRIYLKDLEEAYNQIVYWRKVHIFMVPTGSAGKKFIDEISKILNLWTNTPLKNIALKANRVMPVLLLQKPSKTSKAKDHH